MKSLVNVLNESINKPIVESEEDGKDGHWEEFMDEDTGEIIKLWRSDIDPNKEAKLMQAAKQSEEDTEWERLYKKEKAITDKQWELKDQARDLSDQIKDLKRNYQELRIDMEEELGQLYSKGEEAKGDEKAQEYGKQFNDIEEEIDKLSKQLKPIKIQISKYDEEIATLWEPFWKKYGSEE